jgi:hypothetical protein
MIRLTLATISLAPVMSGAEAGSHETVSYRVRHNHFRGGCDGRLIISPSRISFESLTKIGHSKQLDLRDVRELTRDYPYELSLTPFAGNTYDFQLIGIGMSSSEYQELVERIASARAFGDSQTTSAPTPANDRETADRLVIRARHAHVFGGCDGTLIITGDGITFESLGKATHSRQLQMADIKELKRENPYELTVRPFLGNEYDFQLIGTGLSSDQFQKIVQRVDAVRASQ